MTTQQSLQTCFMALLCVTTATCFLFLLFNIDQWDDWARSISAISIQKEQPLHPSWRPWFLTGGRWWPEAAPRTKSGRRLARLWPSEDPSSDRITEQLMFVPPDADAENEIRSGSRPLKKIVFYNKPFWWNIMPGQANFMADECPVNLCTISNNMSDLAVADAVFFQDPSQIKPWPRPSNQVWIVHLLESPYHTKYIDLANVFNWTAAYRADSDLVDPYRRWAYFDEKVRRHSIDSPEASINYAANKTKKVAWIVSNCKSRNKREDYVKELSKYITVDIYGSCGTNKCSGSACYDMLEKDYKFYLAFENSNCQEYITEKFYDNALGHNVIPIAMGARPEDYEKTAPLSSYIHVDQFESPQDLATYLHQLDADDDLYNEYFRWKGTGEYINPMFFCRLCALLHDPQMPRKHYEDINKWWQGGPDTCVPGSWRRSKPS